MELQILDPFGDYETRGYLHNIFSEKDLKIVGHLETAAFEDHVAEAMRFLRRQPSISYQHICGTHRVLFESVYPWAGEDRSVNAPHIAICKGGYNNLFAHPKDVRRAAEYALSLATDLAFLLQNPGSVFGYLAHSHPFLEGNGRTILTIYAELCRRAGFHIEWEKIDKASFLECLTQELLHPNHRHLDELLANYVGIGRLSNETMRSTLMINFNRSSQPDEI
jgi:cell filamentation protein